MSEPTESDEPMTQNEALKMALASLLEVLDRCEEGIPPPAALRLEVRESARAVLEFCK